jgi:hypothetical protein
MKAPSCTANAGAPDWPQCAAFVTHSVANPLMWPDGAHYYCDEHAENIVAVNAHLPVYAQYIVTPLNEHA